MYQYEDKSSVYRVASECGLEYSDKYHTDVDVKCLEAFNYRKLQHYGKYQ
jgi:hypothetical protein